MQLQRQICVRTEICLPLRLLIAMEKREIATAPPRRPQGRRTPRPPVDGGSVSPTRSTSYLSRSSSWQTFNVLNPRDSGLHKCLQRFSKRLQGVGQYWASTKMLSAAAWRNCGKLEKMDCREKHCLEVTRPSSNSSAFVVVTKLHCAEETARIVAGGLPSTPPPQDGKHGSSVGPQCISC